MIQKRYFLKMTSVSQTFDISVSRLRSIKVENLSMYGDTYKQILWLCLTGNPNAVAPATPIDLCANEFINQVGLKVNYTFLQRGDLQTTNIVTSNRQAPDVVFNDTLTNITQISVTVNTESGSLNVSAINPLCFELLVEMHY